MSASQEVGTGAASAAVGMVAKNTPPVAVVGLQWAGITLDQWVQIAALMWIAIQAGFFLYDRFGKKRRGRT